MFRDRVDAGRRLAQRVQALGLEDPITLGLPRGGVVVAAEVAELLGSPLDVLIVRKVGMPYEPEVTIGAIGEEGVDCLDWPAIGVAEVTALELARTVRQQRAEVERRSVRYRGMLPPTPLTDRTAVIVDDGIVTGSTARTACRIARGRGAEHIVIATPVITTRTAEQLADECDELVSLMTPDQVIAVSQFYGHFEPVSDRRVGEILTRYRDRYVHTAHATSSGDQPLRAPGA